MDINLKIYQLNAGSKEVLYHEEAKTELRKLDLKIKLFDHTVHGDMIEVKIAVTKILFLSVFSNLALFFGPS